MEVKYVNLKVDRSSYNPAGNPRRRSRTPHRRRGYNNKRWNRKKHHYGLTLFVVALVLIAGFTIWNAVTPKLDPVDSLKTNKTTSSAVSLKWKKVKDADGYAVYTKSENQNEFKKAGTVNKKNNTYTVKKLSQLTAYTICVRAYKGKDNVLESPDTTVDVTTLPATPTLIECKSDKESEIALAWNAVPSAAKYQVQYVKNSKDFSKAVTKTYNPVKNPTVTLKGLDKSGYYSLRVRVTASHNETYLNSEWTKANTVFIAENFTLRSEIDPNKPMVALTFDDGPGYNKASDNILDTLEKYGAKATFFMVGRNAKNNPDNVKRKVELGMELGNHTWNHAHYGRNVTPSDISKASNAIFDICGLYPTAFRSPGGMTTDTIKSECKKENMAIYYWTVDTQDWMSRDADKVYNMVMNNVSDGDIVLMHEIYDSTASAVKRIVPKLIKKGYQLVTCRELMYAKNGKAPEAGTEYFNANKIKE